MGEPQQRQLDDWLDSYLDFTTGNESPEKLHLWTALALLSAAVKRQIWMDRGFYKLYTNIYVLMVAESGEVRKSASINIGLPILQESVKDIHTMSDSLTSEGLIKHMNRITVHPNLDEPDKPIKMTDSHVLIYADELASLFSFDRQRASKMTMLLTTLYESRDRYEHTTKSDSKIITFNNYITLLAATDPKNLRVLPEEAIGGLLGRLVFITAHERRGLIAWPKMTQEKIELRKKLVHDLTLISKLNGEMNVTQDAKDLFEKWYLVINSRKTDDPTIKSFMARCHDTALKVAMLIGMSRSSELVLESQHVAGGIAFIEKLLPEVSRLISWTATTTFAQNKAKCIDLIRRKGGIISRRELLKRMAISNEDFTVLTNTMFEEGTLKRPLQVLKGQPYYELVDEMNQ